MNNILYISDLNTGDSIFHSQVVPHVHELKKYYHVTLVVLTRNSNKVNEFDPVYYYSSIRGDYAYHVAMINFWRQKGKLRSALIPGKFDLIYSRSARGGVLGCLINKYVFNNRIPLLNDFRGDAMDHVSGNFVNKAVTSHSTRQIVSHSSLLFLVSRFLKETVCRTYDFNSRNAYVFPTFVPDQKFDFNEENRRRVRKELNFSSEDIVVVYSGNLVKWQNIETILAAFRETTNANLKLLILTRDKEIFNLIKKFQVPDEKVRVKSVDYEQIENYYHAADFGILIRDNTITNKSAAPTKFAEYVNSGLGLIINSIEADYVQLFKNKNLEGFLLDRKEDLAKCFDEITYSDLKRNVQKINTLGEIVKEQKEIFFSLKTGS